MMQNQRRIGVMMSYVTMAVNILIGIFYTPVMLRFMGQAEYGLYSFALSIIAFLLILDLGFGNTLVRFNSKYRAMKDGAGESSLYGMFLIFYGAVGFITLLIGYFFYLNVDALFSNSFTDSEIQKLKIIIIIMVINTAMSFPLSLFSSIITAYERFAFVKMVLVANTILTNAVILLLLYFGFRSVGMALASAVFSIGSKLILLWYCFVRLKIRIVFSKFDPALVKEVLAYSFFILLNIIVDQLYVNTDKVILGAVAGTAEVAIYTIAMLFLTYFIQFSTSLNGVFLPKVTKMVTLKENIDKISQLFIKIGRLQFIILFFIISGFILYGKDFIRVWAGPEYTNAYYIALIIMVPRIVSLSQNMGIIILQAQNRHMFRSVAYLLIAIVNVIITIPLAKAYGGVGAAIGTCLATIVGQIITMNWYYFKRVGLDIPGFWREIFTIVKVASLAFLFGISLNWVFVNGGFVFFILKVCVYTIVFFSVTFKWIFNEYEKGLALALAKKVKLWQPLRKRRINNDSYI